LVLSCIEHLTSIKLSIPKKELMLVYTSAAVILFKVNDPMDWEIGLTLAS
jgi:hypothetical protein